MTLKQLAVSSHGLVSYTTGTAVNIAVPFAFYHAICYLANARQNGIAFSLVRVFNSEWRAPSRWPVNGTSFSLGT